MDARRYMLTAQLDRLSSVKYTDNTRKDRLLVYRTDRPPLFTARFRRARGFICDR